jgi:hypothetical protein
MRVWFSLGLCIVLSIMAHSTVAQQLSVEPATAEKFEAQKQQCEREFAAKTLKTATALIECENAGLAEAMASDGYPFTDLIQTRLAERLAIADRLDRRRITKAEADAQNAASFSRLVAEDQRRRFLLEQGKREADARAAAERASEEAAARERYAAALIQQQEMARADAERRAALMRFSAGLGQPTRSGSFAESLSNAMNAYGGASPAQVRTYAPLPPAYPTQTTCRLMPNGLYSQVLCNSQ